jgi:hypothetical protein
MVSKNTLKTLSL